jgi:hypothetical protein
MPASKTINATYFDLLAIIGAIIAPSRCPINPILLLLISFLVFEYAIVLSTSSAKSADVAKLKSSVVSVAPL